MNFEWVEIPVVQILKENTVSDTQLNKGSISRSKFPTLSSYTTLGAQELSLVRRKLGFLETQKPLKSRKNQAICLARSMQSTQDNLLAGRA